MTLTSSESQELSAKRGPSLHLTCVTRPAIAEGRELWCEKPDNANCTVGKPYKGAKLSGWQLVDDDY